MKNMVSLGRTVACMLFFGSVFMLGSIACYDDNNNNNNENTNGNCTQAQATQCSNSCYSTCKDGGCVDFNCGTGTICNGKGSCEVNECDASMTAVCLSVCKQCDQNLGCVNYRCSTTQHCDKGTCVDNTP